MSAAYRRSPDVVFRRILDEHILVPIRGQVADMQKVFALNPVAALVWESLADAPDVATIVERVAETFAVEAEAAESDVLRFIADLEQEGLIEKTTSRG